MSLLNSRTAVSLCAAAAFAMSASPLWADRWGGGHGWGHRERRDDTGWIVGGIIGIGMIAVIAAAANKSNRENTARNSDRNYRGDGYRNDDYRSDDARYGDNRNERSNNGYANNRYSQSSRGIDGAVESCVYEVERGSSRVDTVDSVDRDGQGWRIAGQMNGGRPFACSIDGEGRIRSATIDGRGVG